VHFSGRKKLTGIKKEKRKGIKGKPFGRTGENEDLKHHRPERGSRSSLSEKSRGGGPDRSRRNCA